MLQLNNNNLKNILIISALFLFGCTSTSINKQSEKNVAIRNKQCTEKKSKEQLALSVSEIIVVGKQVNGIKPVSVTSTAVGADKSMQAVNIKKIRNNFKKQGIKRQPQQTLSKTAKENFLVTPGKSNIYLFRGKAFEPGIPTYVALNGKTKGNTVPESYFKWILIPGKHQITTFGSNIAQLVLDTQPNKNYFVQQEVTIGTSGPVVKLHVVEINNGMQAVLLGKLINK